MKQIKRKKNQKDAVITALKSCQGIAHLSVIYVLAIHYIGNNTTSKDIKANIRRTLYSNPGVFRRSEENPNVWMLVGYHNEMIKKDEQIKQLQAELDLKERLPQAVDVELNILKEVMNRFKHNRSEAGPYRYLLEQAGCKIAASVLDVWMSKTDVEIYQFFNFDNNFNGPIEQLLLKHADVVAGIAEKGSNVFHHI